MSDPVLYYWPLAGRGELIRLIAHVGGVTITEDPAPTDEHKVECGSPSGIPLLIHGDLKLSQSTAVSGQRVTWSCHDIIMMSARFLADRELHVIDRTQVRGPHTSSEGQGLPGDAAFLASRRFTREA